MAKTSSFSSKPTSRETAWGFGYLAFQLLVLPSLLALGNRQLAHPMSEAELNFVFFLINFLAVIVIFHRFLGQSAVQAGRHPAYLCQAVVLGLAAYYACDLVLGRAIALLVPNFTNYNNASIAAMGRSSDFLMVVGTVILVPPVEECLYRGLVFRNLYSKSPWAAYAVSMLAFAAIHILGYIGVYAPGELVIALAQYLPAGLSLAWAYTKADTIFAPILIHAAINYISIHALR